MPTQITNYQCPSCTGPLRFDNRTGRLECDYCGQSFSPEEIEAYYAEKDAQAAAAAQAAAQTGADGEEIPVTEPIPGEPAPQIFSQAEKEEMLHSSWDESTIPDDWGEDTAHMRAYNCPSCGAELLCEETTAATQCPYCGNPSIVPGQVSGSLKPDYIIPFKLAKNDAAAALKAHFRKRIFLPGAFSGDSQLSKIQGVYVPFWLFDASAAAEYYFDGKISHSHRQGDYRITRTDHYDVRRFGTVAFQGIPTDASKKMPDSLMDSLEPYDYSELKPFSTAYLPGYLANKYDVTVKENSSRADDRCANTTDEILRQDVRGYQTVNLKHRDLYVNRGAVHYAMLPVWLLKVNWKNNSYLFAMNGQTGKFVGDLPVSKERFFGLCGLIALLLGALLYFTGIGGGMAALVQELLQDLF